VRLKALVLVFLVFFTTLAASVAVAVTDFQTRKEAECFNQSPSIVCVGDPPGVTPDGEIDTPGGPT
jgi:hypothetical protein